jgi:hypothetical protein
VTSSLQTADGAMTRDTTVRTGSASLLFLQLLALFFLLMLVIPTTFQLARGVLLAVLVTGAGYAALEGRWTVNRTIFMWCMLCVAASLFFMWNGALLGAPGALAVGTVHVMWPLLYLLFIGLCHQPNAIVLMEKVVLVGILVASFMGIVLVIGTMTGTVRLPAVLLESQEGIAGIYEGFIRYRLPNQPTLIYGIGFVLALIALPKASRWCTPAWSVLAWLTLLPMLAAIMLSGRRAAWLVVLMMPFIVFALLLATRQPIRLVHWSVLAGIGVCGLGAVVVFFDLDIETLLEQFGNAFDFNAEESASVRGEQGKALFAGWAERPWLGHGLGNAASVIRSRDQSWAYELSYAALLFHTGVVGMLIYGSAVLWIYWTGIRIVRLLPEAGTVILPLLAGLAGFLIANGTNPYLAKFDYLWVIFLPVAALNAYAFRMRSSTFNA